MLKISNKSILLVATLAILFLMPVFLNRTLLFIFAITWTWIILTEGLNLVSQIGYLSFGHAAFFGVGAYTFIIFVSHVYSSVPLGIVFTIVVLIILAPAVGAVSFRSKGFFFILITLVFGYIAHNVFVTFKIFNGVAGLSVPGISILGVSFSELHNYYLSLIVLVLTFLFIWKIKTSNIGTIMEAISSDEGFAENLGIDTFKYKMIIFSISGIIAGISGFLFAQTTGYITSSSFTFSNSLLAVLIILVGGSETTEGPVIGCLLLILIPRVLGIGPNIFSLLTGVLLIVVIIWFRKGIFLELKTRVQDHISWV